jgi:hypothetical protein
VQNINGEYMKNVEFFESELKRFKCALHWLSSEILQTCCDELTKACRNCSEKEISVKVDNAINITTKELKDITGISTSEMQIGLDVFLDQVANSVFKQKHGKESLHSIVTDALCTANASTLIKYGFKEDVSICITNVIKNSAAKYGISNLEYYHKTIKEQGGSNIINKLVRQENKLYYASRSTLKAPELINILNNYEIVDIPSSIFHKITTQKTKILENKNSSDVSKEQMFAWTKCNSNGGN